MKVNADIYSVHSASFQSLVKDALSLLEAGGACFITSKPNPILVNLSNVVKNQSVDHSQFNIVSPQFKANPFPLVASLRASQPVFRTTLPDKTPVWLLTRYDDVATLL
jgi:hypothetical protein